MSYCGSCGYGSCGGYSLENRARYEPVYQSNSYAVSHSEVIAPKQEKQDIKVEKQRLYKDREYTGLYLQKQLTSNYYFNPEQFLNPSRPFTQFIGDALEIEGIIREAFGLTVGREFPDNITVKLCSKEELMESHKNLNFLFFGP